MREGHATIQSMHRREKELDEYERLLFGEDDAETVEPEAAEEAPAEDAAE